MILAERFHSIGIFFVGSLSRSGSRSGSRAAYDSSTQNTARFVEADVVDLQPTFCD